MEQPIDEESLRKELANLAKVLRANSEAGLAKEVSNAASGSRYALEMFLQSNELWGGAGSIADQAGLRSGRTSKTRNIERALISLGELQISFGLENQRTASWVAAFKHWADLGI